MTLRVLVLIPCFNEEKNIEGVICGIKKTLEERPQANYAVDYLVVDDCSTDGTLAVCAANQCNYLSLPANLGIGGCMQTGYLYAYGHGYDIAIQHDGDGQHDPFFFADVLAPIASGRADMTIGSRFIDKRGYQSTGTRRIGISVISAIIRLCSGVKIHDVTSGYRAVNRKYIGYFAKRYAQDYPEPESIVDAVRDGAKIVEVPVMMRERREGKSSIGAIKSVYYMIKVALSIILYRAIMPKGNVK